MTVRTLVADAFRLAERAKDDDDLRAAHAEWADRLRSAPYYLGLVDADDNVIGFARLPTTSRRILLDQDPAAVARGVTGTRTGIFGLAPWAWEIRNDVNVVALNGGEIAYTGPGPR